MIHNEDSRVKIPALAHFYRLGYQYVSKKNTRIDARNNIFIGVFKSALERINDRTFNNTEIEELLREIALLSDNSKDKGRALFARLTEYHQVRLIDFSDFNNNSFGIVSELTFKRGYEEFRPDITILINGIPIGFMEVKKPNNEHEGIQAEFTRMRDRLAKPELVHFFNQLQVIAFSNNMEYVDNPDRKVVQGSFYSTPNGSQTSFSHFREEKEIPVNSFIDDEVLGSILVDNNILSIYGTPEFETNMDIRTPANSIITSVFSRNRLEFFLKYGIAYVDSARDGLQRHIIRYPQYFAIQELLDALTNGEQKGIVWHTQGSGKTALAFYASRVLRDYFNKKHIVTKFYFVVDRLDLLNQAAEEFANRNISVVTVNSKEDFRDNIRSVDVMPKVKAGANTIGTINVINIQKFSEESVVMDVDGALNIQRIYFLDEVHRSYKPKGSFLGNLFGVDSNGIFIGLTGTPLLKSEYKSTDIFGRYIHKYYYNKSIADGYTLRIKKEEISTIFRDEIRATMGLKDGEPVPDAQWAVLGETDEFCTKVSHYIQNDFQDFRSVFNDESLGCMIVTSSSEQARKIQQWFHENSSLKTALVLHDEEDNKQNQKDYRGEINERGTTVSPYSGVIVYKMLLTGFDAPRLKRLYLLRKVREHNLLQTLARVNRPYGNMRFGYVVDFVDITEEYEETNKRYLEELKKDLVEDDLFDIEDLFFDVERVKKELEQVRNKLFPFDLDNLENFQRQISVLPEDVLREVKENLARYKQCYNELRLSHQYEEVAEIPIERISKAYNEVTNRLNLVIAAKIIDGEESGLLDLDLEGIVVGFLLIREVSLEFTMENDILERINKIKNALSSNTDKSDDAFRVLYDRFSSIVRCFRDEISSVAQTLKIMSDMDELLQEIYTLNAQNDGLTARYQGDSACMRIHKIILNRYRLSQLDTFEVVQSIVSFVDDNVKKLTDYQVCSE